MKTRKGYKTYPLTVAQKFHFFYADRCPKKEILNIGTSLTIEIDLDVEELKKAIYKAYERCESARVRFAYDKAEEQWYQYVVEKEEREIEYVDFTGQTMEQAEAAMTEWTRVPFPWEDSPMNRIVIIKLPDGYQGVFFMGDHRLLDAQSLIAFLSDVIQIYCNAKYEGIDYPADLSSYIRQVEKDLAYEAGSRAQTDREYFYRLIETSEPIYSGIDGPKKLMEAREREKNPNLRAAPTATAQMESAIDVFHLEEEPTQRLMAFCEEHHVSLQCLLIMGIRTCLQKLGGQEDISMNVAYARRATLSEKKSGGTRIHSFPFRTVIGEDKSFLEGIFAVRNGQNEIFRHVNFNPVEYFAHRGKTWPVPQGCSYESISLTYQPASLKEKGLAKLGDIRYKTKWYCNGVCAHGAYLTVMHRPDDNGLDFCFEHQLAAYTREKLEYFYYYICKVMFKGIENPSMKIGDILKLI